MLIPGFRNNDNGNGQRINRTLPHELAVFAIMVITVVMMILVTEPLYRLLGKLSYFVVEMMLLVPAMIYLIGEKFRWKTVLRLNGISLQLAKVTIILSLALSLIFDELDRLIAMIYSMPEEISRLIAEGMVIRNSGDFITLFLGAVIAAALVEEILFRGFLQRTLEKRRNVTNAITTSSILFALIHLNPWWFVQIILLAFVLGILAWRADSIIPPIIVHIINNTLGLWSVNADIESLPYYTLGGHVSPLFLIPALIIGYWGFKRFFTLTAHLHPGEKIDYYIGDEETDDES